jgi:hypothetical protein
MMLAGLVNETLKFLVMASRILLQFHPPRGSQSSLTYEQINTFRSALERGVENALRGRKTKTI